MKLVRLAAFAAAIGAATLAHAPAVAEMTVEVGGAPMLPSKTIVENAVVSKDHTILVAAIQAAGLVETLQGDGPFTVFAPVNKAFDKLPKGMVAMLLEPDNKDKLVAILTYHVVAGKFNAADLVAAARNGGGKATLETIEGEVLIVTHNGRKLEVIDAKGGKAIVTIPDVNQSNGVIHVVDTVLLPRG